MKHIFKKLHHHPNRSNETPQPSPQSQSPSCSASSDVRNTSVPSAAEIATSTTTPAGHSNNSESSHPQRQDYYVSEEEYQVQLAMAISVSSSGQDSVLTDPGEAPIRCGGSADDAITYADSLSRRYWNYGVLDFEERVVDGFYDAYNLSADPEVRGNLPSLTDIESNNGASEYEVIIINRKIDRSLEELMQIAHCIVLDCPRTETALLMQRLAELVTDHLGGPVRDANLILAKWMERSMELRTSLHTIVLPIGSLRVGLLRHRALLFKVLADSVGIPCRLVKGSHYTGIEDDAVNIIKLEDGSECLVDLMGAPGALIPADVLNATPLTSYSSQPLHSLQKTEDANVAFMDHSQNSAGGNNLSVNATSWKPEALVSSVDADINLSQSNGSSLYKGGRGPNTAHDSMRINRNVIPYSGRTADNPKDLFADINPFQIKGTGKSVMQNDLINEVDKLKFPNNNNIISRPPVPLMWKNRQAWNEVSKKNEHNPVEGLFAKTDRGANNANVPSAASISSTDRSDVCKLPEKSSGNHGKNGHRQSANNVRLASGELECGGLCRLEDSNNIQNEETKYTDQSITTRLHDLKQNMLDGLIGTSMELREAEDAGYAADFGANYASTVIDDVGDCEILWEDLVIGERIGLGSYGEVYHADWNGTEVAVKKFLDQDFSGAALDEFKREVRIMRRLRHPNVVLFMGAVTRPPNLSIVSEFLPRGSLYRIIHHPHCQIDEERRIKMALDVAKGMNCLHTSIPTIVHRDLKSPNLLVDNNWNVKVGDFGLSRLKHNTFLSSKSTAGTPEWMAPEVLRNEPSNEKCDVYSFGVILWELATFKLPWSGMNPMQVVGAVGFQNLRLDIPKEVDPLVARIIWECWQMDPNMRPSFAQLTARLKPLQRLVIPHNIEQPQTASLS